MICHFSSDTKFVWYLSLPCLVSTIRRTNINRLFLKSNSIVIVDSDQNEFRFNRSYNSRELLIRSFILFGWLTANFSCLPISIWKWQSLRRYAHSIFMNIGYHFGILLDLLLFDCWNGLEIDLLCMNISSIFNYCDVSMPLSFSILLFFSSRWKLMIRLEIIWVSSSLTHVITINQ